MRLSFAHQESFTRKIFHVFVIFIVLMSSAFTLFSVYYESREAEKNLLRKGELLADLLASSSKMAVFVEDVNSLRDVVQDVLAREEVLAVSIHDLNRRPLFHEEKRGVPPEDRPVPAAVEEDKVLSALRGKISRGFVSTESRIYFYKAVTFRAPVSNDESLYFDVDGDRRERAIGYVKISLDRNLFHREINMILTRNTVLALLFAVSGITVIYMILQRAAKPLINLTEKVRSLGRGSSFEKIPVVSNDEIGRLAEAFNAMTDDLRGREEEKQAMEEKLRHLQKMEAIGRLAPGIAHDFNNILTTVEGALYILRKKVVDDPAAFPYTEQIHKSLSKLQHLIQSLLAFSKTQVIHLGPVDVTRIIRKLKPMLANLAGDKVDVLTILPDRPVVAIGDALQIDQILMNLCANARDAMPDGGRFTVEAGNIIVGKEHSQSQLFPGPGAYVLIRATDTGQGMDQATRERIFEPFFTTKTSGKGTGLGLSIVFGIVEQHRGHIEVLSEVGRGSEFRIYLPALEKNDENMDNKE